MSSATNTSTVVEDLVRQLYGLGMVQREIGRHALAELGSQGFGALGIVHVHGPVRVSDVAQRLGIDLSVASRQVASLAAAGYVHREADPEDRRAHRLTTTPAGVQVLTQSHRRMVDAFAQVLAAWPEDGVAALTAGLTRLRADHAARTTTAPGTPAAALVPQESA